MWSKQLFDIFFLLGDIKNWNLAYFGKKILVFLRDLSPVLTYSSANHNPFSEALHGISFLLPVGAENIIHWKKRILVYSNSNALQITTDDP